MSDDDPVLFFCPGTLRTSDIRKLPRQDAAFSYSIHTVQFIMSTPHWSAELPISITVCDRDGIILEMNDMSIRTFANDGGADLIGTNVLDCHPEPSRSQLREMLLTQSKHVYTIEKNGVKKLIYQSPWFEEGEYRGFIELALEIPFELPHFVRKIA